MAPSSTAGNQQQSGGVPAGGHGGHPNISAIMNQHAVHAHELTKFLKQHFKVPTEQPYKAQKLTRRTSRTCAGQYDRTKWRENFARRQEHLKEGFFTSDCDPYQPIGNIELESKYMVYDVLSGCLPKKLPLPGIGFPGHRVTVSPTKGLENEGKHKPLSPSGDKVGELSDVDLATAGFTFVRDYLKDTRELLIAGKGGQVFDKCVKELEERKRQLAENADTTNATLTFLPPEMSYRDVTGVLRHSPHYSPSPRFSPQYDRAPSALSTESVRSTLSTASRTKPVDSEVELERMRLAFNRNRRAIIQRLDAIYKVMNALHNMKSRDLKTRVPLPHEAVKFLYREIPVTDRSGMSRPIGAMTTACTTTSTKPCTLTTGPMETIQSSATFGGSSELSSVQAGGPKPAGGGHFGKMSSRLHLTRLSAHGARTQDGGQSPTLPMAWKKFGRVGGLMNKLKPQQTQEKDPKAIETWEDLLAVQPHSTGQHRLSVNPEKTQGYGMKWLHVHRHHDHHQPSKQPYWLTVSISSADKAKRPIQVSANGVAKDKHDPEKTLQSLKENFTKTQRKLAREIMTDLERMERERCRTFRQKFHSCSNSPLLEKTVKHMRDAVPVIGIVPDDTDIEIKPSKWYVDMKTDAESNVGKDDPEVSELLQKLARFYLEDSRSIPNSKEKLCLLMMSMPASQLLTIPMQQAIQFVMDNIILAPPESFSQWLQQRKIPQIIPSSQI